MRRNRKYTDKKLLETLRKVAEQLGHTPSWRELIEHSPIYPSHFLTHFGSLGEAQELAGLIPNRFGVEPEGRKYTAEQLLETLRLLAQELGHTPSLRELIKHSKIRLRHFKFHFGSLAKAQQLAGLIPNQKGSYSSRKYTAEQLLQALGNLAKQLGHTPSTSELIKHSGIYPAHFRFFFGSLAKARQAAGLKPIKHGTEPGSRKYADEQLLETLRNLAQQLGHTPTTHDLIKHARIHPHQIRTHFGSLRKAQKLAGLIPNATGRPTARKYTSEELLKTLRNLAQQLGRTPSEVEFTKHSGIHAGRFRAPFGSLRKAQVLAGLIPNNSGYNRHRRETGK